MKILTAEQVRELDAFTIEHEPVASLDLMERAGNALAAAFTARWGKERPVKVFAGPGNNGGDALVLSRILTGYGYDVETYLFNIGSRLSEDCAANRQRLVDTPGARLTEIQSQFDPPQILPGDVLVDGLFGTGLNKPLRGGFAALVKFINASPATVVAIDIPSGLKSEGDTFSVRSEIIHATHTFSFQVPKLAFLMADCSKYVGRWELLDIGLSVEGLAGLHPANTLTEREEMAALLRKRPAFGHKGTFGHALLIAGSYGMAGAAILAGRACLRAGVGKVTLHSPTANNDILQISVPEAIISHDSNLEEFSQPVETRGYAAVGIGPGLGCSHTTEKALLKQLAWLATPAVVDADALNLLGRHREQLRNLAPGTILTPHPKELAALTGQDAGSYVALQAARELARNYQFVVVLKGHYTAVCTPDGHAYFNPTGNAGMATAGSGDVLTGIITALRARGYAAEAASRLGVYLHGLAGDIAAAELGEESVTATDLIRKLPAAFRELTPDVTH